MLLGMAADFRTWRRSVKLDHFRRIYQLAKKQVKKNIAIGVIASKGVTSQPQLGVLVTGSGNEEQYLVKAMADAGAQVCIVRRQLTRDLGISQQAQYLDEGRLRVWGDGPLRPTCTLPRACGSLTFQSGHARRWA